VLDALREFQEGKFQSSKVLVRGLADYDLNDQPVRVAETQHLQLLDPNDVATRCEELSQLKDGWLDGEGKAPTKEGLKSFMAAWDGARTEAIPLPYIYPTPEGGIQMEWRQGRWELSAEVDLASLTAELLAVNVATRSSNEGVVNLSTREGWSKLTTFVTNPESSAV
jgi:hypothetical protein